MQSLYAYIITIVVTMSATLGIVLVALYIIGAIAEKESAPHNGADDHETNPT